MVEPPERHPDVEYEEESSPDYDYEEERSMQKIREDIERRHDVEARAKEFMTVAVTEKLNAKRETRIAFGIISATFLVMVILIVPYAVTHADTITSSISFYSAGLLTLILGTAAVYRMSRERQHELADNLRAQEIELARSENRTAQILETIGAYKTNLVEATEPWMALALLEDTSQKLDRMGAHRAAARLAEQFADRRTEYIIKEDEEGA